MTDTTSNAPADAGGALTTDAAVAALAARRAATDTPADAAPDRAAPAEPTPSGGQPETTADGAEEPAAAEPAGDEEPAQPEVQAPQYWSKEAKAEFANLSPTLQAIVADQERGREGAVGKAKQEAAEARKAAEKEAGASRERSARLGELLPQLEAAAKGKWDGVTPEVWADMARKDPAATTVLRAEYDADMARLDTAKGEAAKADAEAHDEHLRILVEELPRVAPELADEREGSRRVQEVFGYLNKQGIANDQLKWVTAGQLAIARKAMLYDQGQAALKAASKSDPKPAAPALKPGAAATSSPQAPVTAAKQRLARTGSVDDAVAVLQAKRKAG